MELIQKETQNNWDFSFMIMYKDFHFVHQKTTNLINKNTEHLSSACHCMEQWKIENETFRDKNTMNAEDFVEGHEKCNFVSRLLGQNVENLDDFGCPKIQCFIVAEEGKNVFWICFSYPYRQK